LPAAGLSALFDAWWSIVVRLVEPDRHTEAITRRPLLLQAIATQVRHARQAKITVARSQARAVPAAQAFRGGAIFSANAQKCGAADGPATLAAHRARALPAFVQGPSLAFALAFALAPAPGFRNLC
jgi:hypothetical protein